MVNNKNIDKLPYCMYIQLSKNSHIISSFKNKFLNKLTKVWLNEDDETLPQLYIDQANLIDSLHWSDYSGYSKEFINEIEIKYKKITK